MYINIQAQISDHAMSKTATKMREKHLEAKANLTSGCKIIYSKRMITYV